MRSDDIRDLPYKVGSILTYKQMDEVITYCKHDIKETYKFYQQSLKHIKIREFYSQQEGINLINASEITIAKEIFAKYLAKEMKISKWDVKRLRTYRDKVPIKDVILDYIEFDDPINIKTLKTFKNFVWYNTSNMTRKQKKELAVAFETEYNGVIRKYAEGGLHSFGEPGIYESDDEYVLVDLDFASFYPHICFKNGLHPEHIPPGIFNKLYEGFYQERKKYPKSDPRNYVLKIVLNGSYGLSKDIYSMLYDPKWQLAITINGQLLLTLLTEKILKYCKHEVKIIFENTDGAMYRIHRNDLDNVANASDEVEKICNIPLELQECSKIIARDVNNYLNIITDENIKFKGAFEIDKDFHKNHSKRIVPIALANYYVKKVPFHETIYNHLTGTNYSFCDNYGVYDFCHGVKMTGQNKLFTRILNQDRKFSKQDKRDFVEMYGYEQICRDFYAKKGKGALLDDIFKICYEKSHLKTDTALSKTTRYYVSNKGFHLIKKMPLLKRKLNNYIDKYYNKFSDDYPKEDFEIVKNIEPELPHRETNIESGYLCTIMNKFQKKSDYDINYDYYINECNKILKEYGLS
jgi:hypothetical protein